MHVVKDFERLMRIALVFMVSLLLCTHQPAIADLTDAERAELNERASVYRAMIKKQLQNIQKMTNELQVRPDNPNTKMLGQFFATVTGYRSPEYYKEPEYIRALIEKVEKDKLLVAGNIGTGLENLHNVAAGHFKIEIERSRKFIALLRRELKNTEAKLNAPGEEWKTALGKWTSKGTDIEITQDADGIQAQLLTLGGAFKTARVEVGDWLFAGGRPTADKKGIESNRGYCYVLKTQCPSLSPLTKAKVTVQIKGPDQIAITSQGFYYNTRTCKWADKSWFETIVYQRK